MKVEEELNLSNILITQLTQEIPRIQILKTKWSSILTKLKPFPTHLQDIQDFASYTTNILSLELVNSIYHALALTLTLVKKCNDPSLWEGKLRTQSDIDSVGAQLDQLGKDCELLIKSGVLTADATFNHQEPASAYTASEVLAGKIKSSNTQQRKPGQDNSRIMSKRELVRVEARNLITRLQIGGLESKNVAMEELLRLLQEDEKNVLIAVAQGVVPVLVRCLDAGLVEIKEKAVAAIAKVALVESSKHVLVAEGVLLLNHLLRVLESGSGFAKEKTCIALQTLSFSKENARTIGTRGGVGSLLEICRSGTASSQAVAAGVLRNLAEFDEVKVNLVEENVVPVLIGLADSGTITAQENSVLCLCNLVVEDDNLKVLVVREGGIDCVKNFWDGASSGKRLEAAVALLNILASCKPIADIIGSNGFIPRIVCALRSGVSSLRIVGARALYELAYCTKWRKEIGENGSVTSLVKMLDAKAVEEREIAAKLLSCLMHYTGNRNMFRNDEGGILGTVLLLNPSIHNLEKKYPVSILLSIAQSKKCRKQMLASGAYAYLQKLTEMDVEGARKLLESLGPGKLWGVFART